MSAHTVFRGQPLTAREIQVLDLMSTGRTSPQIGETLTLSTVTVRTHIARIGIKLGSGDRAGLVALAFRRGYLEPSPADAVNVPEPLRQVLIGVSRGRSNAEIGRDLHLSVNTVKYRLKLLQSLLGVQGRGALVRAGVQCGALRLVRPVSVESGR